MAETKLRAMRHRDVWQVVNCETTGLVKADAAVFAQIHTDIEYSLRQPYQRLTVAADCHNIVRGYLHADCGTKRNVARIKRLVVHGDWWLLGVGRQLIESLLVQCRDAEVDCECEVPFCMLPGAANFLKKFDFKGTKFYTLGDDEYCTMRFAAAVRLRKVGAA